MIAAGAYAELLGIRVERRDGRLRAAMAFTPDLVGRPDPPRLHGGSVAGLLETIGLAVARSAVPDARLSLLATSIDFLRGGQPHETCAEAEIVKLGRRVVNIVATAWQDDRGKPIAQARISILIARG